MRNYKRIFGFVVFAMVTVLAAVYAAPPAASPTTPTTGAAVVGPTASPATPAPGSFAALLADARKLLGDVQNLDKSPDPRRVAVLKRGLDMIRRAASNPTFDMPAAVGAWKTACTSAGIESDSIGGGDLIAIARKRGKAEALWGKLGDVVGKVVAFVAGGKVANRKDLADSKALAGSVFISAEQGMNLNEEFKKLLDGVNRSSAAAVVATRRPKSAAGHRLLRGF